MAWTADDRRFLSRALELARRGEGLVEPNPMVGAVLARHSRIIGEGWHRRFGGPHAEVEALRVCRGAPRGATCYVTLEPCCHHGKTPPCTDALLAAGVVRVVAAVRDPFPAVAGGGIRRLRAAGVQVDVGLLAREARTLLAPYLKLQRRGRPWVMLKWAQSLDGRIATRRADSRWITSQAARRMVHALRGRVDAVVVGIGTVRADDPALTARLVRPRRVATRIVLDPRLRISADSRLVRTARRVPTMIATCDNRPAAAARLRRAGCEILRMPGRRGLVSLPALLDELGRRRMTNVLVEGGGRVLGSFVDERLADEAWVFVAPRLIGGAEAPTPLAGRGPARLVDAPPIAHRSIENIGRDLLCRLFFSRR